MVENLRRILDHYFRQGNSIPDDLLYGMSTVVLRHFLGEDLARKIVKTGETSVSGTDHESRRFLRTDSSTDDDRLRHQERVVHLAELFYNLRVVPGFSEHLAKLRTDRIEPYIAELEFANHCRSRGVSVRFVVPSGKESHDYDLELLPSDAASPIFCEVKCKVEETEPSENTIAQSLKKAKSQLPKAQPCLIGLKVPEAWMGSPETVGLLESATGEFLRRTRRVLAVVLRWEEVASYEQGGVVVYRFKVYVNAHIDDPPSRSALETLCPFGRPA